MHDHRRLQLRARSLGGARADRHLVNLSVNRSPQALGRWAVTAACGVQHLREIFNVFPRWHLYIMPHLFIIVATLFKTPRRD
jgi:hypothetical protein